MNTRKQASQVIHLALSQRLFVDGAAFAGIWEAVPRPVKQRIFAPGFAEDSDAAGTKDTHKFRPRFFQIEMMQDRGTPDGMEGIVRQRQTFAIRFDEINVNLIGPRSRPGFIQVTVGKIKGRHARSLTRQNDGRHAVATAEIQHRLIPDIAKLLKSRQYPGFMIEVCVIGEHE
jgi:hypothetical protein